MNPPVVARASVAKTGIAVLTAIHNGDLEAAVDVAEGTCAIELCLFMASMAAHAMKCLAERDGESVDDKLARMGIKLAANFPE